MAEVDVIPAEAAAWTGRPLTPGCSATAGFPDLWVASDSCLTHLACGTSPELSGQVACHPAGFRASGFGVPGGPRVTGMQGHTARLSCARAEASHGHTPWDVY